MWVLPQRHARFHQETAGRPELQFNTYRSMPTCIRRHLSRPCLTLEPVSGSTLEQRQCADVHVDCIGVVLVACRQRYLSAPQTLVANVNTCSVWHCEFLLSQPTSA